MLNIVVLITAILAIYYFDCVQCYSQLNWRLSLTLKVLIVAADLRALSNVIIDHMRPFRLIDLKLTIIYFH